MSGSSVEPYPEEGWGEVRTSRCRYVQVGASSKYGLRRIIGDVPHTPLETAAQQDFERYSVLVAGGKIDLEQLES